MRRYGEKAAVASGARASAQTPIGASAHFLSQPSGRSALQHDVRHYAIAPPTNVTIQRVTKDELTTLAAAMRLEKNPPTEGGNLWKAATDDRTLFLIGTNHGLRIHQLNYGIAIGHFLLNQKFDVVRTEVRVEGSNFSIDANLATNLEAAIRSSRNLDRVSDGQGREAKVLLARAANASSRVGDIDRAPLDDVYSLLAGKGASSEALETAETRNEAHDRNAHQGVAIHEAGGGGDNGAEEVRRGNQAALFAQQAAGNEAGRDLASGEERNVQWLAKFLPRERNHRHLWIIGAAHLPGLIVRLRQAGWAVDHQQLPTDDALAQAANSDASMASSSSDTRSPDASSTTPSSPKDSVD